MKLIHFALLLPLVLLACNSKQEKINIESTQDLMEQPAIIADENQEPDLAGRSINIKYIFVLLPENVFHESSMSVTQRKELLNCNANWCLRC